MKRRRYDTETLVGDIQKSRKQSIILSVGGVGVGLLFIGIYAAHLGSTPDDIGKSPTADSPVKVKEAPAIAEKPPEPAVEKPPEAIAPLGPATLQFEPIRNARVWLDDKPMPKQRQNLELSPGQHTVRARFGKRTAKATFEAQADKTYRMQVDGKRRKVSVVEAH